MSQPTDRNKQSGCLNHEELTYAITVKASANRIIIAVIDPESSWITRSGEYKREVGNHLEKTWKKSDNAKGHQVVSTAQVTDYKPGEIEPGIVSTSEDEIQKQDSPSVERG
ncbi:hypothetical protein EDD17DRAFT_1509735 [Pisolithus thermaeus]|nr:hypothetical protein EV401DRAFT_1890983 [Pisolithus croceorrhizus]KAI6160864.1 hypothetical protein EDD17DRAFT_1509735 [Pisolithus thermaeus]